MASASLAARYRPQTFAQVVGQEMVKSILSRAAQEDRVAPAYLLSGTRGVGKTTIARIFAKALNCVHAPTGEPCNECEVCRRITQGGFVDVVEIDGASNRGIDDVRRLRDAVGYAPLEGRYKVFIIDEAHMLTKEAFNALLKTLEEPPARVTFIMATTEQHKFPVTIVSRCQHFVFRQIPESTLEGHIISVLEREARPFEPEAARLIARRAAGSVRDSMSLLGQVLALGGEGGNAPLTAAQTREVLGLAGQEVMERLLDALADRNALAVSALVRELLFQGADMGFFLRELGTLWRNLFLLRQAGPGADVSSALDLPEREVVRLRELAARFSLTFIHAAWQMTLDGQRRILTSLEPAAGLELLLLNLALLPRLLPLGDLDSGLAAGALPPPVGHNTPSSGASGISGGTSDLSSNASSDASGNTLGAALGQSAGSSVVSPAPLSPVSSKSAVTAAPSDKGPEIPQAAVSEPVREARLTEAVETKTSPVFSRNSVSSAAPYVSVEKGKPVLGGDRPPFDVPPCDQDDGEAFGAGADVPAYLDEVPSPAAPNHAAPVVSFASQPSPASAPLSPAPREAVSDLTWDAFLEFCQGQKRVPLPMLRQFDGVVEGDELLLRARSLVMLNQMRRPATFETLTRLAADWAGRPISLVFQAPEKERRTEAELRAEMAEHPVVKALQTLYGGTLLRCTPVNEIR